MFDNLFYAIALESLYYYNRSFIGDSRDKWYADNCDKINGILLAWKVK